MKRTLPIWKKTWAFLVVAGFISEILAIILGHFAYNFSGATCLSPSLNAYLIVYSAYILAVLPMLIAFYSLIRALGQKNKKLIIASIAVGLIYGALTFTALFTAALVCWMA